MFSTVFGLAISQQLATNYAILQVDQAAAHTSSAICWPEYIIPLFQPPSAPELNPIERSLAVSSFKKPLKNQLFLFFTEFTHRIQEIF